MKQATHPDAASLRRHWDAIGYHEGGNYMRSLIWKLRYARYFYRRIGGNSWSDWTLSWSSACISWDECDGHEYEPHESADEELSYWRE